MTQETDKIKDHIAKLYDRIDEVKTKQFELMEKVSNVSNEVKQNSIDDLKRVQKAGGKAGRNSAVKWTAVIMAVIEIIRQLI